VRVVAVDSAAAMQRALREGFRDATVLVMAAGRGRLPAGGAARTER
jgi:hypothetical protein